MADVIKFPKPKAPRSVGIDPALALSMATASGEALMNAASDLRLSDPMKQIAALAALGDE